MPNLALYKSAEFICGKLLSSTSYAHFRADPAPNRGGYDESQVLHFGTTEIQPPEPPHHDTESNALQATDRLCAPLL